VNRVGDQTGSWPGLWLRQLRRQAQGMTVRGTRGCPRRSS